MEFFDICMALLKKGLPTTLLLFTVSTVFALVLGFAAGLARLSQWAWVRGVAAAYVEFFRGTSLLVQLFWIYFVLPLFGLRIPQFTAGVLAIGLNFGAYCSEVVRSSVLAVPEGQHEASRALNFTRFQEIRYITLPQAFTMMLPNLGNQLIELLKSTALVSLINLSDLTQQANVIKASTFQTTEIFTLLLVIYFIISLPLSQGVRWLERKMMKGRI